MRKCPRCNKEVYVTTMSYFNTDQICMECDTKEKNHPKYRMARDTEIVEVLKGNYNFPGIGLPNDLKN